MNEQEFWQALKPVIETPTIYKLYYDDQGRPIKYTVENESGNYIQVTVEQYLDSNFQLRVKNGEIVYLKQPPIPKLIRSQYGTGTHPDDITIVQTNSEVRWSLQTYEED